MTTFQNSSASEKIAYFFLNLFAIIVKRFPKWALHYTVKTNDDAVLFMLPHKKEIDLLTTLSMEDVQKRVWSEETKLYFLENAPTYFLAFIDNITNGSQFDAFIKNVKINKENKQEHLKKIIAQKTYTLNDEQAIRVCTEFECVEELYQNQPSKITANLVKKLSLDAQTKLLKAINKGKNFSGLQKETVSLFISQYKDGKSEEYNQLVKAILLKLIEESYLFTVIDIQILEVKDMRLVDGWINLHPLNQEICDVLKRCRLSSLRKFWDRCCNNWEPALMAQIVSICWSGDSSYPQRIKTILSMGEPLPGLFGYMRTNNQTELFQENFDLCEKKGVLSRVYKPEALLFNDDYFGRYAIAMAKAGTLSAEELGHIKNPEAKEQVEAILTENAQVEWLKKNLASEVDLEKTELYPRAQQQLLGNEQLLKAYYLNHRLCLEVFREMLTLSEKKWQNTLANYIAIQNITKKEYDMLLLSSRKYMAPWAKSYLL